METVARSEDAGGPIQNEHEAPEGGASRPAVAAAIGAPSAVATVDPSVEKLKRLLLSEAARLRQNRAGSMSVVACVEKGSELLIHFTQGENGIAVIARCEHTDLPRLKAIWPSLQQAVAGRRIHVAALRTGRADARAGEPPSPIEFHPERRRNRNGAPPSRPDWETWA